MTRRFAQGAEVRENGTHFRVWAPKRSKVELVLEGKHGDVLQLQKEKQGYFSVLAPDVRAGARYKFRLDGGDSFPDPASRFQPEGPHGPSEVVDPKTYAWTDVSWKGAPLAEQVLYEMHVGTFTEEGTWAAAMEDLNALVDLGVTMLEIMPIAEFPGAFGWGYDGVDWFAPAHIYGSPDDLRRFVDRAHALGLGVILDVVYNHFGPNGNYLTQFSAHYFTHEHVTDWGDAINYDAEGSHGVRALAIDNAAYWIEEFHFDGLRLDATQNIYDSSTPHVLAEIDTAARL
ncbi:MAG TPA: alpha-amylase family glycosyl hydrolase, partial [Polyangiaceae bacterium]